jgi:hypothetical protein
MLLAVLVVVTIAGIAVGQSLETGTSTAVTTSTGPGTTTTHVKHPQVRPQHWASLAATPYGTFPAGGDEAGVTLDGTTLVVVGGIGSTSVLAGKAGKNLTAVAELPKALAAPEVFTLGTSVYALGGEQETTPTAQILRLDLTKGRAVPDGTFEEPLAEAGVVTNGKSVLFVGGWTGQKYATAILKFVPPGTSQLIARLPEGLRSPAVVLLGQTLYIAGGRTETGLSRKVYAVDLSNGKVSVFGTLPQGVEQAAMVASTGGIFVIGGKNASGQPVSDVVRIDPITGYATLDGAMPKPIPGAAALPAGQRTIVVVPPAGAVYRVS